jgi:hypothetical protein
MDKGPQTAEMNSLEGIWDVGMDMVPPPRETVNYEYIRLENHGSNVSNLTNYKVWTTDQNAFYIPSSALLQVDVKMTKNGLNPLTVADQCVLASNPYKLFNDISLRLGNEQVTRIDHPGLVSHVRNLTEAGRDYIETVGKSAGYYLDSTPDLATNGTIAYTAAPAVNDAAVAAPVFRPVSWSDEIQYQLVGLDTALGVDGANTVANIAVGARKNPNYDASFAEKLERAIASGQNSMKFLLPLRDVFNLIDREKVWRGTRIEVEANKYNNVNSSLQAALASGHVITIERFALWIARVKPSFAALAKLESQLIAKPVVEHRFENIVLYRNVIPANESGERVVQIGSKQSRPTKCFIFFQFNTRETSPHLNPLQFDLLGAGGANNITSIELRHNSVRVPNLVYQPDVDFTRIVQELHRIGYKSDDVADSACITMENWAKMYPVFGFSLENTEGQPFESRSITNLECVYSVKDEVAQSYTMWALVFSETSAYFDTSSGITTIKVQ